MHGETVADMVRRLRTAKGWSQERLAHEMCRAAGVPYGTLSRQDVYRYEKEKRRPTSWLGALAEALDVPVPEFEAAMSAESSRVATVADFLPDGNPLAPLNTRRGGRVGMVDVTDLAGRVHGLRLADDVLAGRDLICPALRELRSAVRLYRSGSHTEDIGRALLSQIGSLAQIVGWIAADAGDVAEAERVYQLGITAAEQARDNTLVENLSGSLAYLWSNNGQAPKAVQLAYAALVDDAPPKAQALHWDRIAWAHTMDKDAPQAMRALGKARESLERDDGSGSAPYLYWVSQDELTIMDARVFTELHKPLRAVPLLQKVMARYDSSRTREQALYLSWLAVAYADANEPEESAAVARRVIAMSADVSSERTSDRVKAILRRLQEFKDVPEVRDVFDSVAA